MLNGRVKLSIAIPTFNRLEYIKELLPEMLKQCDEVDVSKNNIEIIIVDNCSTDGTREYIQQFNSHRIKYYRNNINIGGDANFIECVKKSDGDYVWLFGDDEILARNGILKVSNVVLHQQSALIIANSCLLSLSLYFENYKTVLNHFKWKKDRIFPLHHTIITSNIFQKSIFDVNKAYEMANTHYGHMYAIIEKLKGAKGVYVFKKNEIFMFRDRRAPFDTQPVNLEEKLIKYVFFVGDVFDDILIKINIWLFFKIFNHRLYAIIRKTIVTIPKYIIKQFRIRLR